MADPGGLPPDADPVRVAWRMLLNGWGYNWYRADNRMRADDLLVRSRACESLGRAAASVRALDARIRRERLPPPTRAAPDPDPAVLAELRRMRALLDRILALETGLRGAALPPDDRIWDRHRAEMPMLEVLTRCDVALAGASAELEALCAGASDPAALAAAGPGLDLLQAALAERAELLRVELPRG